ncbi:hypothetical protein [Culturomica massiliensis]|uniref:hypothetical protein n=1 Tax=Culturomica massiliensis TaxID=1841857 RepID=UPI0026670FAB|nr:hypothetical protein [Culturomica massiliensis]
MKLSDKKILVVSHNAFSSFTNNGKTLEAILQGFKKENISQLFFLAESPDYTFCEHYFRITDKDILICLLSSKTPGNIVKKTDIQDELLSKKRSSLYRVISKISHQFPQLRDLYWLKRKWCNDALKTWSKTIDPDFIFFVGGPHRFAHDIALFLSDFLQKPLATFFTDDYLQVDIPNRTCGNKRLKKIYQKTIDRSSALFACCDYMSSEYSAFFSRSFHSLLNTMEITPYADYIKTEEVVISYFGGLHLNRDNMIIRLAGYLDKNCELRVYSNSILTTVQETRFKEAGVRIMPCLNGQALWHALLYSDILLHVESDDQKNQKFTRLSLSTKLPEYMMAGRCILAYGPQEVSSIRILKDNHIGCVISSTDDEKDIKAKLFQVTKDFDYRKQLGLSAYNYAVSHLNRNVISDHFVKIINDI